ncbi:transcriptional regulator, PadR-like family [Kribbella flavida DSM 17836]|uniref:Transcriptional regulator, PadR-like family n=1 Tax=Kribbella flavida (strain DSM 17836 / JCM 10339 / NBRC 14399) TaxID=479435 RepID=D2PVR8_KRIFD|nr:PadR family transcriptional regulator [Kribbella flavida]ADB35308.1 transcriptional regulator, PadR-like family [Kribbella flavida DSM 17836]
MSTTRLLLLGVVRIFQPAYGYQLRRELLSWEVQHWANINPGSIYTGLRTLAKHGLLQELEEGAGHKPGRTSYKLTADGEKEYFALLRQALWTVEGFRPDRMQAALSFLWSLRRDEVVAALESRITQLEQRAKAQPFNERQILQDPGTPNHVLEMLRISDARDRGELEWTRAFRDRVLAGDYGFAGEPPDWTPDPNVAAHWRTLPDEGP